MCLRGFKPHHPHCGDFFAGRAIVSSRPFKDAPELSQDMRVFQMGGRDQLSPGIAPPSRSDAKPVACVPERSGGDCLAPHLLLADATA